MSAPVPAGPGRPFTVFIVVGEESGDQLGAKLMAALTEMRGDVRFLGFFPDLFTRAISFADLLAVGEKRVRHEYLLGINAECCFPVPMPCEN